MYYTVGMNGPDCCMLCAAVMQLCVNDLLRYVMVAICILVGSGSVKNFGAASPDIPLLWNLLSGITDPRCFLKMEHSLTADALL